MFYLVEVVLLYVSALVVVVVIDDAEDVRGEHVQLLSPPRGELSGGFPNARRTWSCLPQCPPPPCGTCLVVVHRPLLPGSSLPLTGLPGSVASHALAINRLYAPSPRFDGWLV